MQKKTKVWSISFSLKLEKPQSVPILAPFGPKTSKQNFFQKSNLSIIILCAVVTSYRKKEKFCASNFHKTR